MNTKRAANIRLLKDLTEGRKKLIDLIPAQFTLHVGCNGEPATYTKNDKPCIKEEWDEYSKINPELIVIPPSYE